MSQDERIFRELTDLGAANASLADEVRRLTLLFDGDMRQLLTECRALLYGARRGKQKGPHQAMIDKIDALIGKPGEIVTTTSVVR